MKANPSHPTPTLNPNPNPNPPRPLLALLILALFLSFRSQSPAQSAQSSLTLPIHVTGLPPSAEYIPLSARIDLTQALQDLNLPGIINERSIRLYLVEDGREREIPFQFTSEPQPRPPQRELLPGTSPNVSYLAEYAPGETPPLAKVAGQLTWIAGQAPSGAASYLLKFALPSEGRLIQVPFPPQNFRGFDAESRPTPLPWFPIMRLHPQWPFQGVVHFSELSQLVTTYHLGPSLKDPSPEPSVRRPFFYPVNGAEGIPLTDFGKPHDPTGSHAHHYSLWIAHADVNGHDFWSERGGIIAHERLDLMEDGPIFSRLGQRTRWIAQGSELLKEKRTITLYKEFAGFRILDLELEFTPAGDQPVIFGQTSFGFLAARVAQSMTVFDGAGEIRNSNGDLNEQNAHQKRARWIDQSGPVAPGRWAGIALFDHPSNPNHPVSWHCRNDGWAGASFNFAQPATLPPGATLNLNYRVHIHQHDATRGRVSLRYEEYAATPVISIGDSSRSGDPESAPDRLNNLSEPPPNR